MKDLYSGDLYTGDESSVFKEPSFRSSVESLNCSTSSFFPGWEENTAVEKIISKLDKSANYRAKRPAETETISQHPAKKRCPSAPFDIYNEKTQKHYETGSDLTFESVDSRSCERAITMFEYLIANRNAKNYADLILCKNIRPYAGNKKTFPTKLLNSFKHQGKAITRYPLLRAQLSSISLDKLNELLTTMLVQQRQYEKKTNESSPDDIPLMITKGYDALIQQGFTHEQAIQIIMTRYQEYTYIDLEWMLSKYHLLIQYEYTPRQAIKILSNPSYPVEKFFAYFDQINSFMFEVNANWKDIATSLYTLISHEKGEENLELLMTYFVHKLLLLSLNRILEGNQKDIDRIGIDYDPKDNAIILYFFCHHIFVKKKIKVDADLMNIVNMINDGNNEKKVEMLKGLANWYRNQGDFAPIINDKNFILDLQDCGKHLHQRHKLKENSLVFSKSIMKKHKSTDIVRGLQDTYTFILNKNIPLNHYYEKIAAFCQTIQRKSFNDIVLCELKSDFRILDKHLVLSILEHYIEPEKCSNFKSLLLKTMKLLYEDPEINYGVSHGGLFSPSYNPVQKSISNITNLCSPGAENTVNSF